MDRFTELKKLGDSLTDERWFYRSRVEPTDEIQLIDEPVTGTLDRAPIGASESEEDTFSVTIERLFGIGHLLTVTTPVPAEHWLTIDDPRFTEIERRLGPTRCIYHPLSTDGGPPQQAITSVSQSTVITGDHIEVAVIRYLIDRVVWARELVSTYARPAGLARQHYATARQ